MNNLFETSPVKKLAMIYFGTIALGWVLLLLPFSQSEAHGALDHLFTATSALTTTGLTTISVSESYTFIGELITLFLIQIGGIGYMSIIGVFFTNGYYMTGDEEEMITEDYAIPEKVKFKDFLRNVLVFTVTAEAVGAVVLSLYFSIIGIDQAIWQGIYTSVSSFCTAGLDLFGNSLFDFRGDVVVNIVVILLSLGGSFGFFFYTDVLRKLRMRSNAKLKFSSRLIINYMLGALLICTICLFVLEPEIKQLDTDDRILSSLFQAVSVISTTGFSTVDIGAFSAGTIGLFFLLMFVGASPSGTGGGIKNTVFLTVVARTIAGIRQRNEVYLLGKQMPAKRVNEALVVFMTTLLLLSVTTLVIFYVQYPETPDLFFEVVSALGTVGLSKGATGDLDVAGQILICLLMFAGRIGSLGLIRACSVGE